MGSVEQQSHKWGFCTRRICFVAARKIFMSLTRVECADSNLDLRVSYFFFLIYCVIYRLVSMHRILNVPLLKMT
jgi:hypothetical protein